MKVVTDVHVEEGSEALRRAALPDLENLLKKGVARQLDFTIDSLAENLQRTLNEVTTILDRVEFKSETCDMGEICFSLSVTSTGEFALLSLAKAAGQTVSGLSFKLVRK